MYQYQNHGRLITTQRFYRAITRCGQILGGLVRPNIQAEIKVPVLGAGFTLLRKEGVQGEHLKQ